VVAVRLEGITKSFGDVVAVRNVSLEIPEGQLFFILGPSGCGKTTMLRTVAGFEAPDSGRVYFDGRDVTGTPPHRRNTGMVFQNYALWPHMTVFENVAYGLRVRGLDRSSVAARVAQALDMVRMPGEARRFPNQLSGGQQQRVALARALVIRPACLLLDEPLSNLDAKLRLEMRAEIRRIHAESRVTAIYVTHDQKEALSMAERLAVVSAGAIVQVGAPDEVYRTPADDFVAGFVGETNFLKGVVRAVGAASAAVDTGVGVITGVVQAERPVAAGEPCVVSVRPEDITLSGKPSPANCFRAEVIQYTFLGETGQYVCRAGGTDFKVLMVAPVGRPQSGQVLYLTIPEDRALILPQSPRPSGGA